MDLKLDLQSVGLIRRRIWIGALEIWENLKYLLTVSLFCNSGYTSVSCNLSLPPLLVNLLEAPWDSGMEIPEAFLENQNGRRKTTKKQKSPRSLGFVCNPCVLANFSRAPTLGGLCSLIPLAQFQRNKGQGPLSSQIQPHRSACRTHSILPVLCLTPQFSISVLETENCLISFGFSGGSVPGGILVSF